VCSEVGFLAELSRSLIGPADRAVRQSRTLWERSGHASAATHGRVARSCSDGSPVAARNALDVMRAPMLEFGGVVDGGEVDQGMSLAGPPSFSRRGLLGPGSVKNRRAWNSASFSRSIFSRGGVARRSRPRGSIAGGDVRLGVAGDRWEMNMPRLRARSRDFRLEIYAKGSFRSRVCGGLAQLRCRKSLLLGSDMASPLVFPNPRISRG